MAYANLTSGKVYNNQSTNNNYILYSFIGVDLACSFYEKEENSILKTISCLCIIGVCTVILTVIISKWCCMKR